ncbi:MAG: hypothetical protein JNL45_05020 [Hyphomicrobium sp.]|nr:hypothetical protein [Hyphomicrobium sp.]
MMARAPTRIDADKLTIVRDLFIATADENYITARWCYQQSLNIDFIWLAVHALEKYMKAALLLNGRSTTDYKLGSGKSRSFGHDLEALYAELGIVAAKLLPARFARPDVIDVGAWIDETIAEYMARLHAKGNADNRYMVFGYAFLPDQLAKLDQAVVDQRSLGIEKGKTFAPDDVFNGRVRDASYPALPCSAPRGMCRLAWPYSSLCIHTNGPLPLALCCNTGASRRCTAWHRPEDSHWRRRNPQRPCRRQRRIAQKACFRRHRGTRQRGLHLAKRLYSTS